MHYHPHGGLRKLGTIVSAMIITEELSPSTKEAIRSISEPEIGYEQKTISPFLPHIGSASWISSCQSNHEVALKNLDGPIFECDFRGRVGSRRTEKQAKILNRI